MRVRLHTDGARGCPVARLRRALPSRCEIELRAADDPSPSPDGGFAIRRASRIRPTLAVDAPVRRTELAELATALGASPVAWEGDDDWTPWEACRAPLHENPRAGTPDLRARWALIDARHAHAVSEDALAGWQLHVIGAAPRSPHAVHWPDDPMTIARLLGEATALLSPLPLAGGAGGGRPQAASKPEPPSTDPLTQDAWRLSLPVLPLSSDRPLETRTPIPPPAFDPLLANTLPPLVTLDPRLWDDVVTLVERRTAVPLSTPGRMRAARDRARSLDRRFTHKLRREAARLRDDPIDRVRELRLWATRKLFSSARPGRPQGDDGA